MPTVHPSAITADVLTDHRDAAADRFAKAIASARSTEPTVDGAPLTSPQILDAVFVLLGNAVIAASAAQADADDLDGAAVAAGEVAKYAEAYAALGGRHEFVDVAGAVDAALAEVNRIHEPVYTFAHHVESHARGVMLEADQLAESGLLNEGRLRPLGLAIRALAGVVDQVPGVTPAEEASA